MGYISIERGGVRFKGGAHFNGTAGFASTSEFTGLATFGAATINGVTTVNGALTAGSTISFAGGTSFRVPYHTVSPNVDANGQIAVLQKGNRSYLLYYAGGTPCYLTLPQVTAGTILVTVGGTP